MPIVAVNACPRGTLSGLEALPDALAALPPKAPVIVMVHGYKYDPRSLRHSPHRSLFAAHARAGVQRGISWPDGLGANAADGPLCIGFGWPARGSVWRAWGRAALSALPLAELISWLHAQGRRVHLVAHSMGARVCLRALALAPEGSVDRMILLTGAALRGEAQAAIGSPAGRRAEIVNVTSRENDLFDALIEAVTGLRDTAIGAGLGAPDRRWLDLQIDARASLRALGTLGYPLPAPEGIISHWSAYTRPGVMTLYRDLLADRRLPLALLRAHIETPEARWTRLRTLRVARMGATSPRPS